MAFFDADLPVNNSKLPELEILGGKVQVEEKKGVFFFSKDDITIELTGTFQETKQGIDGTVHQLVCKTGDDEPTWDISGLEYDFDKLFTKIDDGKLDKVIEEMFEKKDLIWGSHFDDKLYGFKGADVVVGWGGNDWIDGGKGKDKLIGDSSEEDKSTGGFGDDTFAFDQALKSSNVDKITDFHIEHDTIALKRKIFSEFDKGKLHEAELTFGKTAVGDDAQVIYRAGKGHLYYDADGEGGDKALKFATIGKDKDLTHDNFLVF